VLLIDKGQRAVDVSLRLPSVGRATVQRLLAPSPAALGGVTLAGQRLGADASWQGRALDQTIRTSTSGAYSVAVPRDSAALVTLRLRAGALNAAPLRGRIHRRAGVARTPVVVERRRRWRPARPRTGVSAS
jgi:hypothetical protein